MQGDNTINRHTHTPKKKNELNHKDSSPCLKLHSFILLCVLCLIHSFLPSSVSSISLPLFFFFFFNGIRNVSLEAYLRIFFFPFFLQTSLKKKKIVRLRLVSPHPTLSIFLVISEKKAPFFFFLLSSFLTSFPSFFFFLCDLKSVELKAIKSLHCLLFFSFFFFEKKKRELILLFLVSFVDIDTALCSSAPTICELTEAICCVQWFQRVRDFFS